MAKNSILVLGSSNTDMVIKVDRIPKPGETILGGEFVSAAGGKGANQAVGAARAGGNVTFIARVGQDVFGEMAVASFAAEGINVDYIRRDPKFPSGVALIFVGKHGENSIAVASGANGRLAPFHVREAFTAVRDANVLVLQLETPLKSVQAAAKLAHKSGVRVILNPAPAQSLPTSLLACIDVLTPNETETELLTGIPLKSERDTLRAADKLLAAGVKNVIITLGSRGAFVAGKNIRQLIPSYRVKAVDTTAAGDVFNGTLAVALAEGKSLLDAVHFANAAAAISVTRMGAQPSAPARKEIDQLLATGNIRSNKHRPNLNRKNSHKSGYTLNGKL